MNKKHFSYRPTTYIIKIFINLNFILIDCTAPYELGIVTNAKSDIDADADTANLVLSRGKFHVLVNSSIFSLLNLLIKVCFLFSCSYRFVSGMDTNSMLRINLVKIYLKIIHPS